MLYVWIILIATALISFYNAWFVAPMVGLERWECVVCTVVLVVAVIAVDGLTAFIVRRMPEKGFRHGKSFWIPSKKEKKFYEKLKIRKWKDKVPELGQFTGFRKNKIDDPSNNEYLERYFLEVNYGQVGHFLSVFTSFLILWIFPKLCWTAALPVAIVSVALNVPSLFILRYNSYKLETLYQSNARKAARKKAALVEQEPPALDEVVVTRGNA